MEILKIFGGNSMEQGVFQKRFSKILDNLFSLPKKWKFRYFQKVCVPFINFAPVPSHHNIFEEDNPKTIWWPPVIISVVCVDFVNDSQTFAQPEVPTHDMRK